MNEAKNENLLCDITSDEIVEKELNGSYYQ
jgi:hypothetical protein